jgi:hypothetical protein
MVNLLSSVLFLSALPLSELFLINFHYQSLSSVNITEYHVCVYMSLRTTKTFLFKHNHNVNNRSPRSIPYIVKYAVSIHSSLIAHRFKNCLFVCLSHDTNKAYK